MCHLLFHDFALDLNSNFHDLALSAVELVCGPLAIFDFPTLVGVLAVAALLTLLVVALVTVPVPVNELPEALH